MSAKRLHLLKKSLQLKPAGLFEYVRPLSGQQIHQMQDVVQETCVPNQSHLVAMPGNTDGFTSNPLIVDSSQHL